MFCSVKIKKCFGSRYIKHIEKFPFMYKSLLVTFIMNETYISQRARFDEIEMRDWCYIGNVDNAIKKGKIYTYFNTVNEIHFSAWSTLKQPKKNQ